MAAEDHIRKMEDRAANAMTDLKELNDRLVIDNGYKLIDLVKEISEDPEVIELSKTMNVPPFKLGVNVIAYAFGQIVATCPDPSIHSLPSRAHFLTLVAEGLRLDVFGGISDRGRSS